MFTLLDYDASRYLLQTLAPRMHRMLTGGCKPLTRKTSRSDDRDLYPRSHFTLTSARSAQGHHGLARMTSAAVPSSGTLLKSSLNLLRRKASGQSRTGSDKGIAPEYPPLQDCSPNVEAFRNARKFLDIPGPTAAYQSVPFASTRLLYYPFSKEKVEDMGGMLSKLQSTYGPIMRVRLGSHWIVFIESLADIQQVVSAYEKELSSRGPSLTTLPLPRPISPLDKLRQYSKDPALAWLDAGAKPQKLRSAVNKHLSAKSLAKYQSSQDAMAQDFIRQLDKCLHSPQDVQTLCQRYTIENSGQLCFNRRLGLLGDYYATDGQRQRLVESYSAVIRCLGEIQTGTRLFYTLFNDPFASRFREARAYVQTWERRQMREVTMNALKDKGMQTVMSDDSTLLIIVMDDKALSEEDISDILHALMATRSEASASALLMLLASLATNVDKQEKLASDIIQLLGPDGGAKKDCLKCLPFLGACINESLRVHFPMSSGGQVILSNNIVLSNYIVPAGMPIELNSRRTAKNPLWFDHANFYVPERWLGERSDKIPPLAFMPLGFMDHGCLGIRSFFFQEIAAVVVKIVQKYKIDLPEEYHNGQLKTVHTPFRTPKDPLPFIFTPRCPSSLSPTPSTPEDK